MALHPPPRASTSRPQRKTTGFLLLPRYTVPLERIDELLAAHTRWLDQHFAEGCFLASGRQVPRRGGVILAALPDRAAAEAITADDPFVRAGAAEYDIIEFVASRVAEGLDRLKEMHQ